MAGWVLTIIGVAGLFIVSLALGLMAETIAQERGIAALGPYLYLIAFSATMVFMGKTS